MKILITGCHGQVGHCLVKQLVGKAEVLAVDKEQLDITDQAAVYSLVSEFVPNYVINAAAYTAVDKAEDEIDLSFAINRDGPAHLAEAAESCGAVMLHISTDYVFDGLGREPYRECDVAKPQGVYGQSKLAGEELVADSCDKHLILRTAWVFGEHGNNFVKTMLNLGSERDTLSVVADQFGGPTYAGDIASALISMVESVENGKTPKWGVYHFSGLPHVSWYEFAQVIFEEAYQNELIDKLPELISINTESYPTTAKRPKNSRLDCEKINNQFGIVESDWRQALHNIKLYVKK